MCGRYFFDENIAMEQYHKLLERKYDQTVLDLWAKGEVFPSSVALVLGKDMEPLLMNWGMELFNRRMINSRLESIRDKNYYRAIFENNPCVVVVSGFYEWNSQKKRHYVHTDDRLIYLAALYQPADELADFSIITKPATATASIHERAPVIMNRQQAEQFIAAPSVSDLFSYDPGVIIENEQVQLDLW